MREDVLGHDGYDTTWRDVIWDAKLVLVALETVARTVLWIGLAHLAFRLAALAAGR